MKLIRTLMRPWFTLLLLLLLGLLLAGCGKIPLASLWALRKFDFETFDAAELRAAVWLPPGVEFAPDALAVNVKLTRGSTSETQAHKLMLRPSAQPHPGEPWPAAARGAGHWVRLSLDAPALRRVAEIRERTAAWKAEVDGKGKKDNRLELGIHPALCRSTPEDGSPQRTSVWLRWDAQRGYVALLDNEELHELSDKLPRKLPPCESPA